MTSNMDLRPIIEAAFLPMKCVCVFVSVGLMTIRISNPATETEEFTVTGIDTTALVTIRDIVALVLEVRSEMRLRRSASYLHPKGRQT
ncbi:Prophage PssSM-02, Orf25 [Pseudomonas coronafaciens pv. striafaciens]|uniref:DUF1652 domain-containing protein n=1 Tax=Pseudomonas coronafaciens TaxID=53409 RepID=UPI000EFF58D3|nr:DUF1652 domain-containing protein [Pseudomonas coronafaciens]RMM75916.1 Prophage PssSM-02, Orf25 [Pseudomonas coronafaciens pv. striafaciens]